MPIINSKVGKLFYNIHSWNERKSFSKFSLHFTRLVLPVLRVQHTRTFPSQGNIQTPK